MVSCYIEPETATKLDLLCLAKGASRSQYLAQFVEQILTEYDEDDLVHRFSLQMLRVWLNKEDKSLKKFLQEVNDSLSYRKIPTEKRTKITEQIRRLCPDGTKRQAKSVLESTD